MTALTSSPRPARTGRHALRLGAVALLVTLGLMGPPAWAAPTVDEITIDVDSGAVEVGDTVTVTVGATGVEDLYAYLIDLEFDPDVLEYDEGSASTDITGYNEASEPAAGAVRFVHTKMGTSPSESGDVTLMTATFTAVGEGETGLGVEVELTDPDGSSVGGSATTPGDAVVVSSGDDDSDPSPSPSPSPTAPGAGGGADDGEDAGSAGATSGSLPMTGLEFSGLLIVLALLAILIGTAIVIGNRRTGEATA